MCFPTVVAVTQRDHCKCKQAGRKRPSWWTDFCHLDPSRSSHPKHSWSEANPWVVIFERLTLQRGAGVGRKGNRLLGPVTKTTSKTASPQSMSWAAWPSEPLILTTEASQQAPWAEHNSWSFPCWRHFGIWIGSLSALPQECGHKLLGWLGCRTGSQKIRNAWKPILVRHRFMKLLPSGLPPSACPSARAPQGATPLQPHGGGTWCWRWIKALSLRSSLHQQRPTAQGS